MSEGAVVRGLALAGVDSFLSGTGSHFADVLDHVEAFSATDVAMSALLLSVRIARSAANFTVDGLGRSYRPAEFAAGCLTVHRPAQPFDDPRTAAIVDDIARGHTTFGHTTMFLLNSVDKGSPLPLRGDAGLIEQIQDFGFLIGGVQYASMLLLAEAALRHQDVATLITRYRALIALEASDAIEDAA
jgi:hypothetical protein